MTDDCCHLPAKCKNSQAANSWKLLNIPSSRNELWAHAEASGKEGKSQWIKAGEGELQAAAFKSTRDPTYPSGLCLLSPFGAGAAHSAFPTRLRWESMVPYMGKRLMRDTGLKKAPPHPREADCTNITWHAHLRFSPCIYWGHHSFRNLNSNQQFRNQGTLTFALNWPYSSSETHHRKEKEEKKSP